LVPSNVHASLDELDRQGKIFLDPVFNQTMGKPLEDDEANQPVPDELDDEDQYPEGPDAEGSVPPRPAAEGSPRLAAEGSVPPRPAAEEPDRRPPVGPGFTMGALGSLTIVDDSVLEYVRSVVIAAGGRHKLTSFIMSNLLTEVIHEAKFPFSNLDELLSYYEDDPTSQQEIIDLDDKLRGKKPEPKAPAARPAAADENSQGDSNDGSEWEQWTTSADGGGTYISPVVEECYVYSEQESLFNRTGDQDAYDYLCKSWKLDVEKEKVQPFMTTSMQILIAKKILTLMRDKENDALNQIYLTHYGNHDEQEIQSLLRRIYDYFTLQGIFVPMTRDERPLHSLPELLAECMRNKIKFMEMKGDEMSFDNAYANILCIQIFGKHITIMIDDLSNGKLPIPYGIQNHLCHDPLYPETFTVTFNVLKCLTLALPQCISLVTYVSYLNLLVGESFLHNLYTDSSFTIVERIHDSFFQKMKRMQVNDRSGGAYYLPTLPNLFVQLPPVPGSLVSGDETPSTDDPLPALQPAENTPALQPAASTTESPAAASLQPTASTTESPAASSPLPPYASPNKESHPDEDYPLPPYAETVPGSPLPGAASGGTKRNRRYKQKTKRNQTLSKRFKKNRTRRLHGLYIRN
jgi:hypothetical protein